MKSSLFRTNVSVYQKYVEQNPQRCCQHRVYLTGDQGCCCSAPEQQLCLTLCDPLNLQPAGFLCSPLSPEFAQTHVHWVSDAIQPSHPLPPPPPPALSLSQHQGLFQWVGPSHQLAKVLELQLQSQSFQWIFMLISFRIDWFDLLTVQRIKCTLKYSLALMAIGEKLARVMLGGWGGLSGELTFKLMTQDETVKKAEHWRINAFKLWCWRRLLRVPWTARSNQSILKEISPEYSLEGLMLKLKLQYSSHLMQRANSLKKTQLFGKDPDSGKDWGQ